MTKTANNKDLEQKYAALITEPLQLKSVEHVNHKPHPFMIGGRHVTHAADHHGGMLGEETLRKIPCAWSGCGRSYDEHTSDRALIVQLTRDCTNAEVAAVLFSLKGDMEADGLDGVAFVQSGFKVDEKDL